MPVPDLTAPTLTIVAWADPVIDSLGFDARSAYVEAFWLGILGPSTTLLLRRLAAGLDEHPDGFELSLGETASALGLGTRGGRNSPMARSLARCCQFGAAMFCGSGAGADQPGRSTATDGPAADGAGSLPTAPCASLAVRRRLPPLTRTQLARLSPALQAAHRSWMDFDVQATTAEEQRRRSRRLALSLAELGEDTTAVEQQLHRWRFHPALAHDAARWAVERHAEAEAAAREAGPGQHWGGDAA